jgi:hypothetical protein
LPQEALALPERFVFMLATGFVLFGVGALARTYMNIKIGQVPSDGTPTRSTEVTYLRLVRNNRAPIWPLAIAVTFIPLGIVTSVAAIIWSNRLSVK